MRITSGIIFLAAGVFFASIELITSSDRASKFIRELSPGLRRPVRQSEQASSSQQIGPGNRYGSGIITSSKRTPEYLTGLSPGQRRPFRQGEQASSSQQSGSGKRHVLEYSSQTYRNPESHLNAGPSSSSVRNSISLDQTSPDAFPFRSRSRSPTQSLPPMKLLGYPLEQLGYIRLIPRKNPNIRFEFRSYVFPADQPIRLRTEEKRFTAVPTEEQIVLSTSNGDIYAILDYEGYFRGLNKAVHHNPRVKLNMMSGAIDMMTADEMKMCPVGKNHAIFPTNFNKALADDNSLHLEQDPFGERIPRNSLIPRQYSPHQDISQVPPRSTTSRSPPGRPPSDRVLGFTLKKLGLMRLIPDANHNRRFEFRRYVIPAETPIRLHWRGNNFMRVPLREHIVLSTSYGDVFALLEYTGVLRGIYMADKTHARAKINMISGVLEEMTASELSGCHVGESYPMFPRWFNRIVSKEDSLQHVYH